MNATYRVPAVGVFTPGDLRADADTLHEQVLALDDALSAHGGTVSDTGIAFLNFENDWNAFYVATFGGFFSDIVAALNNGNRDQLVAFEVRFAALADALADDGVELPGGVVRPENSKPGLLGDLSDTIKVLIVALVVFAIVWKVVL